MTITPHHKPSAEPTLAMTNCDSFEGQSLALHLAHYLEEETRDPRHQGKPTHPPPTQPQLLCLVRDVAKAGELNKHPMCKVVQISYDDGNTISVALRGIQTVVFVPEIVPQRIDWANIMVDVMKKENIQRCIAISSIGTDAPEKVQLDRFRQVEDRIKGDIPHWTVLREGFPFQTLFYWIPMVQDQGILGMPIKRDVEYAPLDISDLAQALISVTFPSKNHPDHRRGENIDLRKDISKLKVSSQSEHDPSHALGDDDEYDGQTYTLTGPETATGPKLAHELTEALGSHKHKDKRPEPIAYKELRHDELRQYLLNLRNRSGEPTSISGGGYQPVASFFRFLSNMTGTVKGTQLRTVEKTTTITQALPQSDAKAAGQTGGNGNENDDDLMAASDDDHVTDRNKPPKRGPELGAPNDTEIDLILELLEYINEKRATFQSGDLEKITGKRGNNAKNFFEEHRRNFRQRLTTTVVETLTVQQKV
ncbi:hypothetical protein FBU30_008688 [Linnemannia zychae]|nr:hypothetical protein FBU30_008688 [Linnemannia zychae]